MKIEIIHPGNNQLAPSIGQPNCQILVYGPTQVKCPLLISSIFDAMNFQHLLARDARI